MDYLQSKANNKKDFMFLHINQEKKVLSSKANTTIKAKSQVNMEKHSNQ